MAWARRLGRQSIVIDTRGLRRIDVDGYRALEDSLVSADGTRDPRVVWIVGPAVARIHELVAIARAPPAHRLDQPVRSPQPVAMDGDLFDLTGKVALVTGGSRGLGRAMVLAFAEAGADVVIASRKLDACEAVATQVEARFGRRAETVPVNVSSWSDCDALVEFAYGRMGQVDILVNNAGMSPLYPSVDAVSEALWDKVLGVNLKGPFRLAASIGARMAEGEGGSIINISSMASMRPGGDVVPYAAAKAGLNAMTMGLAQALAPKVRVNAIVCGMFRTDISKAWGDPAAVDESARRLLAVQRIGEPEDIVGAALYLASSASAYCTASLLRLDGGSA